MHLSTSKTVTDFCSGQAKTSTHAGDRLTTPGVVLESGADEVFVAGDCEGGAEEARVGTPEIGTEISVPFESNCAVPTSRLRPIRV